MIRKCLGIAKPEVKQEQAPEVSPPLSHISNANSNSRGSTLPSAVETGFFGNLGINHASERLPTEIAPNIPPPSSITKDAGITQYVILNVAVLAVIGLLLGYFLFF